jgi:ACS family pantothenate transporter-like MFS transporter
MLSALTIGWWLKNIDQSNVSGSGRDKADKQLANAYVSGMKEDLNILANQYTYMGTIYNAVSYSLENRGQLC